MPYTHTFEIIVNGINIQGDINFDQFIDSHFKTSLGEEMSVVQHGQIQSFLEAVERLSYSCGEITKIEIVKK
jgi:hypothetical protein